MWSLRPSTPVSVDLQKSVRSAYQNFILREDLGFKKIERFDQAVAETQAMGSFFKGKKILVVIGMGGSSLGTKALYRSLWAFDQEPRLVFLDNVDGFNTDQVLDSLQGFEGDEIGWLLCSKSGGTIEVLSLYDYAYQFFQEKHNCSIIPNTVVICGPQDSALMKFCSEYDLPRLNIPEDVGGRFSVFTPVGVFPLHFMGLSLTETRKGFLAALEDEKMICELSEQLLQSLQSNTSSFYCFHYADRLSSWALWLQQLWSESLSKKSTRDGAPAPQISTFVPCRGASDQHSVLQQVIEGNEDKLVGFVRVKSSERSLYHISKSLLGNGLLEGKWLGQLLSAQGDATELACQQAGLRTFCLETTELDAASLAYLMGLWMMTIGVLGEAVSIDAFNQPGVESGKIIARRVLSESH